MRGFGVVFTKKNQRLLAGEFTNAELERWRATADVRELQNQPVLELRRQEEKWW